jgi:hypothetical protein
LSVRCSGKYTPRSSKSELACPKLLPAVNIGAPPISFPASSRSVTMADDADDDEVCATGVAL